MPNSAEKNVVAHTDADGACQALYRIHHSAEQGALIRNLQTRLTLLQADELALPVTTNDGEADNAWVCSPLTTYWQYAKEELQRYQHLLWYRPLLAIIDIYGRCLRAADIDKTVIINNWMLSTNLYPRLDAAALTDVVDQARCIWPQHAIWFRSLNREQHADWLDALQAIGFQLIPSRQVYLYEDIEACKQHQCMRRDLHLLTHTKLQRVADHEIADADYASIASLYQQLYTDKYSRLNPQYTAAFMRAWHRAGLLHFIGFKDGAGQMLAVVGIYQQGNTVTAPIVGYDTSLPKKLGLYRLLMAAVFDYGRQHGKTINLSAGAAHFKRLRGGSPAIEYSAVLARHMPRKTRIVIKLLSWLTTRLGIPVMKRYKL
ncbi:GNAT family N-acetyltransferase [Undibacterium sp. TS12]|uniref:GNAT family N-acetyltransferase n=1 Tax=Undibacterium sp. TS12 TaxID=2908202 RepID=UPI001F4CCBF9|nr:GNAT family N-acetyltransferase [Undibacterium sp. TS12]MCH8619719.1 GNAT family N-acetyltransferase [Undibacterium sp. TS12]